MGEFLEKFHDLSGFADHLLILFAINLILASSLNIINGFCGLFSLGHAGFFAVGAYSSAIFTKLFFPELTDSYPFLSLLVASLIGILSAGIAGLAVGIPCLRLTGDYLCIATIGFAEIIRIVLNNMDTVGASRGMPGISKLTTFWVAMICAALTVLILSRIIASSFGRAIVSLREDEVASHSMGINIRFYKTFAFVLGSSFAGLAGALFAHFQQFLHPTNFQFMISVNILLMIVIGGIGSQRGAIIGAFIITMLPELLRFGGETISNNRILIFGLLMIGIMLWRPGGLMSLGTSPRRS